VSAITGALSHTINLVDLRVDRDTELPLGTQLAWKLRALIENGKLQAGDRLPSVREAATAAGVNVNTVRAVYARLEREGLVSSQHGRGTFVAPRSPTQPEEEAEARRALRRQIAALEAELARRPPPPTEAPGARQRPPSGGMLLSAEELANVRDGLLIRLRELDAARASVLRQLEELPETEPEEDEEVEPPRAGPSTPSLAGVRVRWVGAS
jgi:DNA-binding transcriptional regulator YhcF (GntR family)